ncbi:MAG: GNAT family N-acetyltransferase [Candidatus Thorarchaeota archaeon]
MRDSNTFLLQPGNEAMFEDYAALYNAVDSMDNPDHVEISGNYFRSSFSHPSVEVGRDVVLIQNREGALVAAGTIFSQGISPSSSRIMIQVHPDFRSKGIGSMILEHLLEKGKKRGTTVFECRMPSFRTDARVFAESRGFKYDYSWIKMRLEYDEPIESEVRPKELRFRVLDPKRELKTWVELHNEIYSESYDRSFATTSSLRAQANHINFEPRLLVVCEAADKPVGIGSGWSSYHDVDDGEKRVLKIQGLGVLPKYRRRGYGQALLVEMLNRAFHNGYRVAELVVHNTNQAAIDLYTKYKFQERYRHLWYRRDTSSTV